jgi:hypothetical protein
MLGIAIVQRITLTYSTIVAPRGGFKVGMPGGIIERDGGLKLEYSDGCFGIYAHTPPGRQRPVW